MWSLSCELHACALWVCVTTHETWTCSQYQCTPLVSRRIPVNLSDKLSLSERQKKYNSYVYLYLFRRLYLFNWRNVLVQYLVTSLMDKVIDKCMFSETLFHFLKNKKFPSVYLTRQNIPYQILTRGIYVGRYLGIIF